ncbi:hypothetical protein [Curtobacterium poinsettiae]|uniref:hypothetical protein n=1 Tax=Curtobacterium poinsettiae TaxID=159612 RepID=UPI001BDEE6C4|nr:hypothetical protein [Curtobacterium flaccumfaciens]MBT1611886.1 hypothetical protein [Curtobacterium flaccumfaciens pv. poinsettiae]
MPDLLDDDIPEPQLSKRHQRRARRQALKQERREQYLEAKEQERLRRRRALYRPRSGVVLAVGAVLVFGGIAVVGALVPKEQDTGPVKILHQDDDTTSTAATTEPSAPTSTDAAASTSTDPQTVGADWVVAYFSGGDWQQLTAEDARAALTKQRSSYFDGKLLTGNKVNVSEWTWREVSTVSPQWAGTVDVLLQPGRDTRLVASLRVTIDTTGTTPVVSRVDTLFYGEA